MNRIPKFHHSDYTIHLRLPTYPEFSATGFSWRFRSTTWMIRLPQVYLVIWKCFSQKLEKSLWNRPFYLRYYDCGLDIDGFIIKPFLGQKDPEKPLSKCATGLGFFWGVFIPQRNQKKQWNPQNVNIIIPTSCCDVGNFSDVWIVSIFLCKNAGFN